MSGEWLLIETLGSDLRVVAQGAKPRGWRRLGNVVRGEELRAVDSLVKSCRARGEAVLRRFGGSPDTAVGQAIPLIGPSGDVYAVQVYLGRDDAEFEPPPKAGTFEWEPTSPDRPPRLWLSEETLDILCMDVAYRDRAIYGPADLFTRTTNMASVAQVLGALRDPGLDGGDLQFTIRRDDGVLRRIHYVYRGVETPGGLRVRGSMMDVTASEDRRALEIDCLDSSLAQLAFGHLGVHGAVVDTQFVRVPYVVKWLTTHPAGMGHGASTGQPPGIHPDDLPVVARLCVEARTTLSKCDAQLRIRRAGGGWMQVGVSARILNAAVFEDLMLVTMDTEDAGTVRPTEFPPVPIGVAELPA
ncbi:MAG: DUF5593 domain-containing protein [Corynebacteriales bacterium]|nr:DUF5593 domain-containing protein [Mycobacteriales bacterium]